MKTRYGSDTFAKNRGRYIYLHEGLKEFPKMLKWIKKHELLHSRGGLTTDDIWLDLTSIRFFTWDVVRFFRKHPRALFWAVCPVSWDEREVYVDWMMVGWLVVCLMVLFLLVYKAGGW
jgi:hypothetical protein